MKNTVTPAEICCIFVFYYPVNSIRQKIEALAKYGYKIVVVSNGSEEKVLSDIRLIENVNLIQNDVNVGLATALNQGIDFAFENTEIKFVTLFDQDSEPTLFLPKELANEFISRSLSDVGCIGPQLVDRKSVTATYRRHNQGASLDKVISVPTSGSVISKEAYKLVGPMMDELFIDGIDHEWCIRASTKGLRIIVSRNVTMLHDMGDDIINWFGNFKPLYRNPIRHYYIIRNAIYLSLHADLTFQWRTKELVKTFRRIPVYIWASNDRLKSFKLIWRGVVDGGIGKLGPLCNHLMKS